MFHSFHAAAVPLRRNVAGVLLSRVNTAEELYDSTRAWRQQVIAGTLHSGSLVSDPRYADRTRL